MPKKSDVPLQTHKVRLYAGHMQKLQDAYGPRQATSIIRMMVARVVRQIEAGSAVEDPEIQVILNTQEEPQRR